MATRWRWIRRDPEDLGGLLDLLFHLVLRHLPKLQRELQILSDGHVRIQGIVLKDHGDIPVLGGHVVDQLVVDVELAPGDVLQSGDHPQRGRLAAARRTDKDNELSVADLQVEIVYGNDALFGDLQIEGLLLDGFFLALSPFPFFLLFFLLLVRIDLLDMS